MSDESVRIELNDICISGLIRLLRQRAGAVLTRAPRLSIGDIAALRARWALSRTVQALAIHTTRHPRSIGTVLHDQEAVLEGTISGTVDARESALRQLVSGDPSVFVGYEPGETTLSGPNHVVAWVLREAEASLLALLRASSNEDPQGPIHACASAIDRALRIAVLKEVAASALGRSRPGLSALRAAAKARNVPYQLALDAYRLLEGILRLDQAALVRLLNETLVADLDDWQKFELATAIAAAESLARGLDVDLVLGLTPGRKAPFAVVGPFEVWWQQALAARDHSTLDESERMERAIASHIGVDVSASRADVVVKHSGSGDILSIFECKWFESELSLPGAVSDASGQIARYVRDARASDQQGAYQLLAQSWLIVTARGSLPTRRDGPVVRFTDLRGLATGDLDGWARSLSHAVP